MTLCKITVYCAATPQNVTNILVLASVLHNGFICTTHVYDSTDKPGIPIDKVT